MRADKASKQTAETFQASATFLELLQIWGPLERDVQQKIKFAKFHALRIVKALKAGEDPNLSNPKQEPAAEEEAPPLDPNDPEVQALNGVSKDRQPLVVDVPDETDRQQAGLAPQSSLNESIHPSRAPSAPPPNETNSQAASAGVSPLPKDASSFYNHNQNQVSPISPDRQSSVGGNYFPRMPSPTSAQTQPNLPPTLPSAPNDLVNSDSALELPSAPPDDAGGVSLPTAPSDSGLPSAPTTFAQAQPIAPKTPLDSFQAPPTPGQPPVASIPTNLPQAPSQPMNIPQPPPPINPYAPPAPTPSNAAHQPSFAPPPAAPSQPTYISASQAAANTNVEVDEESMMKAQKHARWAISALNFEDVPTAIKEFQLALQTLGAR